MKRAASIILAIALLVPILSIPASAERASDQIAAYSISATAQGTGKVKVTAYIAGTHNRMTQIGFPVIVLYEQTAGSTAWSAVSTHTSKYNPNVPAGSHGYTFTHQGVAGRKYYAAASFKAVDALGSDTRTATSSTISAT